MAGIFNKAVGRIPQTEKLAILDRWLPPLQALALPPRPAWSDAEAQWLAQPRLLRLAYETKQAPFSFTDQQDQAAGLLLDLMRQLQQRAGLQLQWVAGDADSLLRHWRSAEVNLLLQ